MGRTRVVHRVLPQGRGNIVRSIQITLNGGTTAGTRRQARGARGASVGQLMPTGSMGF